MTVTALAAVGALASFVSSVVGTAEQDVGTPDLTVRLHIERPADALCVDPATDRATMLNSLMEGDYGPIGEWQSADGATTIQLGPDQWLFIMGDSTIGPNNGRVLPAAGYRFINNSVIVQDGNCFWGVWRGKDTGEPARSLFLAPEGDFYWPSDGYFYGGRLVIGLHQGHVTDGGGMFGFEITDRDFVVVDISDGITGSLEFERGEIIDRGPWDDTALGTISGRFLDADPTIFNFAVPNGDHRYTGTYLAKLSDLSDPTKPWRFWNGSRWVADVTEVADIAPDLELTDQRVIVPFEFDGGWYAMGGSWTTAGITYVPLRADSMFGPFEVVGRAPAIPLRGRSTVGLQYGHALHGTDVLGDGVVLMRWSNNEGRRPTWVARQRPSFAAFDLTTMKIIGFELPAER